MDSNFPPGNNPPPFSAPPPPPNRPPPIMAPMMPARPAPRKSGTVWMVLAIVFVVLLAFSVLFNLKQMVNRAVTPRVSVTRSYSGGPRLMELTLRDNDSSSKIAVIPVEGVISGDDVGRGDYNMVSLIKEEFKRAERDRSVKAVILKVDSPGGEVLASDEIAKIIRQFETGTTKPVVVSMGNLAASGGYYISAPCHWIVANELTITGSIGVIMHGYNYRGLMDKVGIRPQVFKSGKFKDMLSSDKEPEEITQEEKDMVQNLINETYGKFKNVVADGRKAANQKNGTDGKKLAANWADYADGRILSGTEAMKLGFVDELGDFDVAVDRAKTLAHILSADIIQYQPVFNFSGIFGRFFKSEAKPVKIEIGLEMPKLHAGYLYFLSPLYLHF